MMTQCPRCGFTQPTDKYCAQCGIDMERALQKQKGVENRLLKSSAFYIFLSFVVIAASWMLIQKKSNNGLSSLMTSTTPAPSAPVTPQPVASKSTETLKQKENTDVTVASMTADTEADLPLTTSDTSPSEQTTVFVAANDTASSTAAKTEALQAQTLTTLSARAYFIEMLSEASGVATGRTRKDSLFDSTGQIDVNKAQILSQMNTSGLTVDRPWTEGQMVNDPRIGNVSTQDAGYSFKVDFKKIDKDHIESEVDLVVRWPDSVRQGQIITRTFKSGETKVSLKRDEIFILATVMGRKSLSDQEKMFLSSLLSQSSLLQVMLRPRQTGFGLEPEIHWVLEPVWAP